jgi:hypothetical protein
LTQNGTDWISTGTLSKRELVTLGFPNPIND